LTFSSGATVSLVGIIFSAPTSLFGAGAVVTKDVPDYALVVGNPGRQLGWMCECGERIRFNGLDELAECGACKAKYEKKNENVRRIR